ncbi:hypothetical protein [Pseudomonas soli]|uniref:Uncharacterized protein n=1 Tax=Pseudomonas soli TaxID=1306993 RepID=A0AAJ5SSH2_9PSED|nr:hypothetical protein [Pseudomonas soli]UXZ44514.1 hypothetical protein K7K07_20935 [Pseudomonas soli]
MREYKPQVRYPRGVDPKVRKQSGRCDVCGKSRAHFKHELCAKARQAAGFVYLRQDAEFQRAEAQVLGKAGEASHA